MRVPANDIKASGYPTVSLGRRRKQDKRKNGNEKGRAHSEWRENECGLGVESVVPERLRERKYGAVGVAAPVITNFDHANMIFDGSKRDHPSQFAK